MICRRHVRHCSGWDSGGSWQADYPPAWTVCYWAAKWQADGSTETMHGQLGDRVRQVAGHKPAPTAAIVDSQSVRASEEVAQAGRGYDAGKKINGRKRHIAVDTIGLLLTVLVTAASVQDRDAAKPLQWNLKKTFPRFRWVVERTLAWITRHRRTVRDYERLPAHQETYVYWAMIIVMTRRLARKTQSAAEPLVA
jgi:putative transposase